jgi:hypothetical protein
VRDEGSFKVLLRKQVGTALHSIPGFLQWRLNSNLQLSPWTFTCSDQQVELLVETEWVEKIRKDKGKGEMTGVDREGRYEAAFCDMFVSTLSGSSVLLDIGAACGLYSVIAAQRCPATNIHCFEPEPVPRYILHKNNRMYCNGQLHIVPRFISSETKGTSVALDDYCASNGIKPTVIKMDIEGAEIRAVAGMRRICLEDRPVILMEFHLRKLREKWQTDPYEVIRILESYGYRLRFNGHHWHLVEHTGERDSLWHDRPPNNVNCALLAEPLP